MSPSPYHPHTGWRMTTNYIGPEQARLAPRSQVRCNQKGSEKPSKSLLVAGEGFGGAPRRKESLLTFQASGGATGFA